MPAFANSHFVVDLATLCLITVFITATGGALLLFAWMQNRGEPALALWGLGYLTGSAGAALLAVGGSGGALPGDFSTCGANALLCCAYGIMWAGARSFEGRSIHLPIALGGAAIWVALCHWSAFYQAPQARLAVLSIITASYVLLSAFEVWRGRDPELISRWPTLALLVMHAGFLLGRIALAGGMPGAGSGAPSRVFLSVMALEALFAVFCLAFLRVSMAKERAELQQRKAALTDELTGIANRRDFFERGARLLESTAAERRPAALLLFDLDRFKEVNDGAGHHAGDHVLRSLTGLVETALRPDDLFARLGGDEFACLLPGASMAQALHIAERVRSSFAALPAPGLPGIPTVSVGLAMASEAAPTLSALLATADRALYRAKAEGRNRVAPAAPVLVDKGPADKALIAKAPVGRRGGELAPLLTVTAAAPCRAGFPETG